MRVHHSQSFSCDDGDPPQVLCRWPYRPSALLTNIRYEIGKRCLHVSWTPCTCSFPISSGWLDRAPCLYVYTRFNHAEVQTSPSVTLCSPSFNHRQASLSTLFNHSQAEVICCSIRGRFPPELDCHSLRRTTETVTIRGKQRLRVINTK
jgi:hypothetical protein